MIEPLLEQGPNRIVLADPQRSTSPVPPLTRGRVLACGPGKWQRNGQRQRMDVQPGQVVQFERYHALELPGRPTYYLIDRYHLLAIESG